MKKSIIIGVIAVTTWLVGCGNESANSSASQPSARQDSSSRSFTALPALTAWQRGDKAAALANFLSADWNMRPLFPGHSPLSLTEDQFRGLSRAQQDTKSQEILTQISSLKQLAQAVAEAGREAASKGDLTHARKSFTSMKQFGAALTDPTCLQVVQLVGKAIEKSSDSELAKLPR
jgi:hypothetical protein